MAASPNTPNPPDINIHVVIPTPATIQAVVHRLLPAIVSFITGSAVTTAVVIVTGSAPACKLLTLNLLLYLLWDEFNHEYLDFA
jgi:hypothetical protein